MNEDSYQLELLGPDITQRQMASIWFRYVGNAMLIRRSESDGGNTSLPLAAIIGIVVGATMVVFSVSGSLLVLYCLRRKHRCQSRESVENEDHGHADMDIKTALRCTQPPELPFSRRHSFNPFLPLGETDTNQQWADHDMPQHPSKTKRSSLQRSFLRVSAVSAVRDSWPLASNNLIPLAILPNQSTMVLSPVAPPGYVIEDRGPNRSSSRLSRRKSAISVDTTRSQSPKVTKRRGSAESSPSQSPSKSPRRSPRRSPVKDELGSSEIPHELKRRATSETQLSTILRSTSQRLKAAQRQSLTRTLTTIGKFPGMPPLERLQTPPRGLTTESREELIDSEYTESLRSSLLDCYTSRTPSPGKYIRVTLEEPVCKPRSPTPTSESADSLCARKSSDVAMTASLKSPSKNSRGEKRPNIRISSGGCVQEVTAMIHKDIRVPIPAYSANVASEMEESGSDAPHRTSLASDPVYSSVLCSKPIIPGSRVQGPRPMPFRKATFGHGAAADRPFSFSSPLKESTGNIQYILKEQEFSPASSPECSPEQERLEPNPFQWSHQETSRMRSSSTSPTHGGNRRCGHKRSTVVRISNLKTTSRPPSIVESTNEENIFEQPKLRSNVSDSLGRVTVPPQSPTPSPSGASGRKFGLKPPSSLKFEPALAIPDLPPRSVNVGLTLGQEDVRRTSFYSPTMSACRYYFEAGRDGGGSENEFACTRPLTLSKRPVSVQSYSEGFGRPRDNQTHGRNRSSRPAVYPDLDTQRDEDRTLFSFPPPCLADHPTPILSPPPSGSRPLPNITSTTTGATIPAPSLLTTSLPSALTSLGSGAEFTHLRSDSSPPRNSLHASINLLRRMNSDVSHCSNLSAPSNKDSPIFLPSRLSNFLGSSLSLASTVVGSREFVKELPELERGRSRGSKHYLSMGSQTALSPSGMTSLPNIAEIPIPNSHRPRDRERSRHRHLRDSHRVHKERRRRKFGAESETEADDTDNIPTPRKDKRGDRDTGWEFDDTDRDGGNSDRDTGLTPVREIASPPETNGTIQPREPQSPSNNNALGIMGLKYRTIDIETDKGDIYGGTDVVTPQKLHRELEVAKRHVSVDSDSRRAVVKIPLGFGFEAFRPVLGRPPSLSLNGPVLAAQASAETEGLNPGQVTRWSDMMTKPAINVPRRESKMEHPAPQLRWALSALGIPGIGLAAATRLFGSGSQRMSVASSNGQVAEVEERNQEECKEMVVVVGIERPESLGLYDQDGFLRSSPDREARQRRK